MYNNCIGEYIKASNGRRVGYLLAFKENGSVKVGWSLYNKSKEDVPFDSYMAKALAYMRASNCIENYPPSLTKNIERFVNRCCRYFKVNVAMVK